MSTHIIARGDLVLLRDWLASDVDPFVRWMTQGEWRLFDAPWEDGNWDRDWFLQQFERESKSWFRARAVIATPEGIPLGWVNRYGEKENPHVCYVGIDICEDAYLDRGLGTEALRLWVDHVFATSDVHKLALETWSSNSRMIRVAEKGRFRVRRPAARGETVARPVARPGAVWHTARGMARREVT